MIDRFIRFCRCQSNIFVFITLLIGSGVFSHLLTDDYSFDGGHKQVGLSAKLLLVFAYTLSLLVIVCYWRELKKKQVNLFWLWLVLIVWLGISILIGQSSIFTLMRLLGFVGCTLMGVLLYAWSENVTDVMKQLFGVCLAIVVINFLYIDWTVLFSFSSNNVKGVFIQKNLLGHVSFLTLFIACFMSYTQVGWYRVISLMSIIGASWLLYLSTSMTSNLLIPIALYAVLSVIIINRFDKGWLLVASFTTTLVFILVFKWNEMFSLLGKSPTFTNRTSHWKSYWKLVEQKLWSGHGYGAYPFSEPQTYWITAGSHNGYLETLYYIGIIGTTIMLAIILISIKNGYDIIKNKSLILDTSFLFGFMAAFLSLNITETYMLNRSGLYWPLFVYATLQLTWLKKQRS